MGLGWVRMVGSRWSRKQQQQQMHPHALADQMQQVRVGSIVLHLV
jgi:hypothetical protein